MAIAALICFAILLIAWMVAPDASATGEASPVFEAELAPAA